MLARARTLFNVLSFLAVVTAGMTPARSQDYPVAPVKVIVQVGAGSAIDVVARIIAERLTRTWGQQVILINHAGAGGAIASRAAATAAADGYTLFLAASSVFVLLSELQANLPFDVHRDLTPLAFVGELPFVFAAATSIGADTLPGLITLAKQQPGKLHYAASTRGSLPHLTVEAFRERAGIDLTFVPYSGSAGALKDVVGGQIAMIVDGLSGLSGSITGGSLRALAVAAPQRLPNFPNLPTVAETVPGFTASGWLVMVAPTGTPEPVMRKIRQDLNVVLAQGDLQQKLEDLGTYRRPMSPGQLADFIRGERQSWKRVLDQVGIKPQ
jgi:tripartite-type tricarboxylate transporter receptor subunit TctC